MLDGLTITAGATPFPVRAESGDGGAPGVAHGVEKTVEET
jgi:hypothetical protein